MGNPSQDYILGEKGREQGLAMRKLVIIALKLIFVAYLVTAFVIGTYKIITWLSLTDL